MTSSARVVDPASGAPGARDSLAARFRFRLPWLHSLVPALPIAILAILAGAAVAAPLLTPFDPLKQDLVNSLQPPAWAAGGSDHLLGTDGHGRDVFTRLLYGARVSFTVATLSLVIAMSLGTVVGLTAGYVGGWLDSLLMRFVDLVLALPRILVALVLAIAVGPSVQNLILVLGLLTWPRIARLVRGEAQVLKKSDHVRYAVAIGVPGWIVIIRHVLPNVLSTLMIATTLEIGHLILSEASLSFLGAGVPLPQPSWGGMISDGKALLATGWWIALFPGLAITLTVLAFNSLGDWLRDYFDPKTRQGR